FPPRARRGRERVISMARFIQTAGRVGPEDLHGEGGVSAIPQHKGLAARRAADRHREKRITTGSSHGENAVLHRELTLVGICPLFGAVIEIPGGEQARSELVCPLFPERILRLKFGELRVESACLVDLSAFGSGGG